MIPGQIGEILQRPTGQWGVPGLTVQLSSILKVTFPPHHEGILEMIERVFGSGGESSSLGF